MAVTGLSFFSVVLPLCAIGYALIKEDQQPLEADVPTFFEDTDDSWVDSQSAMKQISPGIFKDSKDPGFHMIKVAPGVFKPYRVDSNESAEDMAPPALLQTGSEADDAASTESETGFGRLRSLVKNTVDNIKQSHAERQKLTEVARAERDKASLKTVSEFGQRSLNKFGELSRDLGKQNRVRQAFNEVQRRQGKKARLKNTRANVAKAALKKLKERKAQTSFSRYMLATYAGFLSNKRPWLSHDARHEYLKSMVNGMHQEMKKAKTRHGARTADVEARTADGEIEASSSEDFLEDEAEVKEDIGQDVQPEVQQGEGEDVVDQEMDRQDGLVQDTPQSEGNAAQTL